MRPYNSKATWDRLIKDSRLTRLKSSRALSQATRVSFESSLSTNKTRLVKLASLIKLVRFYIFILCVYGYLHNYHTIYSSQDKSSMKISSQSESCFKVLSRLMINYNICVLILIIEFVGA